MTYDFPFKPNVKLNCDGSFDINGHKFVPIELQFNPINWSEVDILIKSFVAFLRYNMFNTFCSCQGGLGHNFRVPTVRVRFVCKCYGITNGQITYVNSDYKVNGSIIIKEFNRITKLLNSYKDSKLDIMVYSDSGYWHSMNKLNINKKNKYSGFFEISGPGIIDKQPKDFLGISYCQNRNRFKAGNKIAHESPFLVEISP